MIKFILLLPLKIIGLLFMTIGAFLERREKERIAAARDREKRIAAAQKEEERREKERIQAERAAIKWEWAQEREQERRRAAEWKERCYISKLGLEYQNAVDNETYTRVRGTELYTLLDQYEQELIDAVDAGNAKRIEQARKKLINTRRLLRENEKAVYMDQFKKSQYKAYSGE